MTHYRLTKWCKPTQPRINFWNSRSREGTNYPPVFTSTFSCCFVNIATSFNRREQLKATQEEHPMVSMGITSDQACTKKKKGSRDMSRASGLSSAHSRHLRLYSSISKVLPFRPSKNNHFVRFDPCLWTLHPYFPKEYLCSEFCCPLLYCFFLCCLIPHGPAYSSMQPICQQVV